MTGRKLVKRIRRRMWGGLATIRVYDDGSARMRFDHPSDDPEIEMAMAGHAIRLAREIFQREGLPLNLGPMTWRSDPPDVAP